MSEDDGGAGEVFTVTQDFKSEDDDSIGVHRGEKVVLIATKTKDPLKNGSHYDSDDDLDFGVHIEELLDNSAARHKIAVRPKRTYTRRTSPSRWAVQSLEDPTRKGLVPIVVLQAQEEELLDEQDIIFRKEAVISELLETEEEFCRDLKDVVERYIKPLDGPKVPRSVSDKKDSLFGNFREISIFHNTVLLEGIKYYAKEPKGLGRAFLRMERDFDKHVAYCYNEPSFQEFLQENESIRNWFEDLAARLRDDKNLGEHLKLPVQRINDYQLLLKELVKYCEKLGEDTTDLEKALELMLGIPHRAEDLKYLNNIEGYHGDIHKLGRLLRHNWFKVTGKDGKPHDRYLFLFKARILVCKVRKISDNRYVFVLKEIIRLPEVELRDHRNDPKTFEVGPFTISSHKDNVKDPWLAEIRHYAKNAITLAEHAADDLRLQIEENEKLEPLKGVELDLAFGQALSDEEMPKAPEPEPVTKTVEEPPPPPKEPTPVPRSPTPEPEVPEDTTCRCKIDSLFSKTVEGFNVEPGGTAVFECEIDCKTLVWLKDNQPFDDDLAGRATQMSQGTLHRLEIAEVQLSDAGVYTAHATLADGRITHCTANLIVQPVTDADRNKPRFVVQLRDTELLENTYLRFMVKITGDPNPEVNFYKDDKLITYKNTHCAIQSEQAATGYYELIIPEVGVSDAGVYKCVATNEYGEASCEGIVKVVDGPKTKPEAPVPTPRKDDKKIFQGYGDRKAVDPEFQWIKDGQPFDPEERFKVLFQDQEDSLALVFTKVKPEDAGLYTCVASTSTGKISCSAELTVQGNVNLLFREPEAPKVTAVTKVQETNIGSSAMLETKVTGYPKPDVKWVKDEKDVEYSERMKLLYEDDETIALVIKNVTLEDMGEYKAVASNVTGKSEDTISLNVKAAPTFTKKLTDVHTISGKPITLSVEVEANPKPMVAWYKDGKQILESDHVKLTEEGKSYTLHIESSSLFDVGSYSIVCKNNISQSSEFCKVDIEGAPVFTRNLIKRVETEEGDSLTFLVKVHGTPMPTVQWFFKGKPVVTDARCKITSDNDTHSLTINAIAATDAGEYTCTLTNLHGTNSDKGQVCVKTAPTFIKGMGHVMAQEKDTNVGFTVQVASFPKGKVRWFYNETEITESNSNFAFKEMEDNYTLIIKEVAASSAGKYRCKIENQYGSNESTAELTVLCRPQFKTPLKDVTVNEGDTLTLKVEIEATPEPQIKWFKDGEELTESAHIKISRNKERMETYELTVNLIKEEDGGEYEVRAVNEMGTAVTKSTVVVQATSSGSAEKTKSIRKESTVEGSAHLPVAEEVAAEEPQKAQVLSKEEKAVVKIEHESDVGEIQDVETRDEDNFFEVVHSRRAVFSGFRCVEVTTESILEESCCGIVEEFSDSEDRCSKLSVTRGVSIVSVSEDEETPSPVQSRVNTSRQRFVIQAVDDDEEKSRAGSVSPIVFNVKPTFPNVTKETEDTNVTVVKSQKPGISSFDEASDECTVLIEEEVPKAATNTSEVFSTSTHISKSSVTKVEQHKTIIQRSTTVISENDSLSGVQTHKTQSQNISIKRHNAILTECSDNIGDENSPKKLNYGMVFEEVEKEADNASGTFTNELGESNGIIDKDSEDQDFWGTSLKTGIENGLKKKHRKSCSDDGHIDKTVITETRTSAGAFEPDKFDKLGSSAQGGSILSGGEKTETNLISLEVVVDKDHDLFSQQLDKTKKPSLVAGDDETVSVVNIADSRKQSCDEGDRKNSRPNSSIENVISGQPRDITPPQDRSRASSISENVGAGQISMDKGAVSQQDVAKHKPLMGNNTGEQIEACDVGASRKNSSDHTDRGNNKFKSALSDSIPNEPNLAPENSKGGSNEDKPSKKVISRENSLKNSDLLERQALVDGAKRVPEEHVFCDERRRSSAHQKQSALLIDDFTHSPKRNSVEMKPSAEGGDINGLGEEEDLWNQLVKEDHSKLAPSSGRDVHLTEPEAPGKQDSEVGQPSDTRISEPISPTISSHNLLDKLVIEGPSKCQDNASADQPDEGRHVDLTPNTDDQDNSDSSKPCLIAKSDEPLTNKPSDKDTHTIDPQNATTHLTMGNESNVAPQLKKNHLEDVQLFETWEHKFIMEVHGIPHPIAKWTKDGQELPTTQRFKLIDKDEKYILEITDAQREDSGEYKVVVSNVLGEQTASANLKVVGAGDFRLPQILTPLKNLKVPKGHTTILSLVLSADPIPEVRWEHDGKPISPDCIPGMDSKISHHGLKECTYTLTISSSQHVDTGMYKFFAENKSGSCECLARLDVTLKPEIKIFKDILGVPYEDSQFIAVINSNPRCAVTWRKEGNKITASDHFIIDTDNENEVYKLKIKGILPEDAGMYTLSAVNEIGEASADARLKMHMEEPEFTKVLENITVREYAALDLKVRAQGVPKPEIQWSKDGIDLEITEGMTLDTRCEGSVSSHLSIPHFKEEYVGKYKVRAYSLAGHVDTTCYVKLAQLSPSFSKSLGRALEVEEGEPLQLTCKVEASPIASVKWFKDGEELPESDRIQLVASPDGHIKLRIEEATPEDCGAYKLVVENALGADSSICAVAVNPNPRAPIFIKKLEDVSINEGQPLFMQAQVMGFPLPEMKWFKDGLPLRNTRSVNFINSPGGLVGLSVEKATSENAGNYSLTVTNRLGEATSAADVEVILKDRRPEFQGYLTPTTVVVGFPVKLTVKVGGNPPPEFTWTKNGSPIDVDGERIKVVELPDGIVSLIIDSATPLDSGVYGVVATNSAGTVSSEAKLDVVDHAHANMPEEAPSFGHALRDAWAEEGSVAYLAAPYLGNPVPDVKWFKNGVELSPDYRLTFTNDGHKVGLQINPCTMGDMESYKCKIINPLGEAESEAKLTVKKVFHAPVFTQKLRDLEQIIGLDGKMVCHVTGNPRPEISWFMNGKPIFEGNRYKMKRDGDHCLLYIKDCSPDEDGYYKCMATNRDGKDSTEAQFRAVEKISPKEKGEAPCFLKKIGDQELIQGMTGRFTACISGYPEPEVEWYRNNDKLYPSDRISIEKESTGLLRLSIAHVDPDVDAGKYRVRIYNDHGEDECDASFIFDTLGDRRPIGEQFKDFEKFKHTGAPMPLADRPIISRMSDRRLTLSWKPSIPYGPREPVTYQVEMCELPNGDWFTARSGIRSCACEIRNLEPFRDYKFRVRVENKYGISDPSPYAMTYRSKLEPEPAGFIPFLAPGIDFRPESSPYFPKDFDIERPPHDGYAQAPRFLRQEHYTQYGVKSHNCNLFWFVYGYPKPKMAYFFNNEPIDMGGRYDCSYTRNGQATLFINKMLDRDVGTYEAVATNEHGEARQRVHLEIAEYPEFVKRPDEMTVVARHGGRLEARVVGVPQPEVKWFKDWQPLASTSRIKMNRIDPDHCNLVINEAIAKDAGLYSITASNVAGAVSCSVMVHVEEKDEYAFQHYGRGHGIKTKTKPISDWYDLGDELGRGTQGVTYHAVERTTGRNFAAKIMHGRGELKSFMHNELEIMNQLNSHKMIRIHDAFETLTNVTLIIELAAGGELLDAVTRQPYTSESEIASYIRQLLVALDYLHDQNIAHLGVTPGDLLVSHPGGDDLRLADFGLARRIHPGQLQPLDYGMPEFVSPETIRGEGVDVSSDMWSVGVITYLLLTGVSLFRGANDKETLIKVREGFWEFDEEYWKNLSVEARDFVSKLLVVDLNGRIDVKTALRHPWLNYADRLPPNLHQIPTEKLHNYYNLWKDWYSNASCRTWYRRRPLTGAFNHPSKMVYPPHYVATPLPSPERDINEADFKKPSWTDDLPSKQPLNYDLGVITSESHYQNGPDTYLLQLRDVDFPVRIREYMKVAANRGSAVTRFSEDSHLDWRLPVIRERRRFTDVMDEEIDDERKSRINQYGYGDSYTVRRLKHEIGSRLDTHVEAEALIEASREGQPPFMREKPQLTALEDGKPASLSCLAVGDPKPTIQWYKNDMMFGSSNRVKIIEDDQGRSIVQFNPANSVDAGIYKVVARNRSGQTVARTRMVLAVVPDAPDSPQATEMSDTQVLLKWKQPKVDGNSAVISYSLQYQQSEGTEWKEVSNTIDHEFYLVNRLKPATGYLFRLACRNAIGWSEPGIPSEVVRTLEEGCEKIHLSPTMKHLQSLAESGIPQESNILQREELDYSIERAPVSWQKQLPTDKYTFVSEICRGRFSVVVKGVDKTNDRVIVGKLCDYSSSNKPHVDAEFDNLKSLRHERIATLVEAYLPFDANYAVLIFEKLQGADVLTYLSSRHEYTEQMVATIIQQVLDGLQYLHWRNLCHLDLQPDNIVMASVRSLQVKLVDLGSAQRVTKLGNVVKFQGNAEFTAPEVLCQEPAYPQSDIWSVGVLAYVMLSGVSPFIGENPGETRQNINFVRFRFEHLYKELTQEATRFIMHVFKRAPTKRPCAEECQEHRWLLPSEYMIKRRERAVFLGSRIKDFSDRYHQTKLEQASSLETLTNLVTGKDLQRSNSIVEELATDTQ